MSFFSRPYRQLAASVALACFSLGLFSAYGAHAFDRHRAVTEARAAAVALEDNRAQFEDSILKAEEAVSVAQGLEDEERISQAADALSESIAAASDAAAEAEASLSESQIVTEGATLAANEVAVADPISDELIEASDEFQDAAADVETDLGEVDAAVADVERVLSGDVESPSEARAATERLTAASEALDAVAQDVDAETQTLEEATAEIALAENLLTLDATVEAVTALAEQTTPIIDKVGQRVVTASAVTTARSASSTLAAATAAASQVDRTDADFVAAALDDLNAAAEALDSAMGQLQTSHEGWLATENTRRDQVNASRMEAYDTALAAAREAHKDELRDVVAQRQAGWTGQPAGVSGSNGRLAKGSLCAVDFADGHYLQCDAAEAIEAADADYYEQTGKHLVMTDSYRSYGLQVTTKARKPSTAARPGTSNHGWGMAVDLDYASARWLAANGADYGWVHPTWARAGGSRPEWWHLEFVAADVDFDAPDKPALLDSATSAFGEESFGVHASDEDGGDDAASDDDGGDEE
ncbi:M15 family metallopeptidase [Demequina sp. NBRC 110056]|uniref:M15 family metallopeptidase n=1 Tax=Demequina sp. NBRC 110056 TaxID=1570345 RepID=UPI000A0505FB|nr:M15 family metallopeptidase [Demequina sp. NBRC 110056]